MASRAEPNDSSPRRIRLARVPAGSWRRRLTSITLAVGQTGLEAFEPAVFVGEDTKGDGACHIIKRGHFQFGVFGNANTARYSAAHDVAVAHRERHRLIGHVPVAGRHGDSFETLRLGLKSGVDG